MKNTMFRSAMLCAVTLGVATPAQAAETRTFTPSAMTEQLCPKELLHGDREFDGHGPHVKVGVNLKISEDGRTLKANIGMRAKETQPDSSETYREWTKTLWTAPAGKKISAITSPRRSFVEFDSEPAGFQFIAPSDDMQRFVIACAQIAKAVIDLYEQLEGSNSDSTEAKRIADEIERLTRAMQFGGNHVYMVPPTSPGPVATFSVVGDTGGPDISTDDVCKDDTRIERIDYAPITVTLVPL
jgi:hypothetical protein